MAASCQAGIVSFMVGAVMFAGAAVVSKQTVQVYAHSKNVVPRPALIAPEMARLLRDCVNFCMQRVQFEKKELFHATINGYVDSLRVVGEGIESRYAEVIGYASTALLLALVAFNLIF